jgi:hypothetical protein
MHNPVSFEIWKTAFGKDFGRMAQGNNKTKQNGTTLIFLMTHKEIKRIPKNQTLMYGRVVMHFFPQKVNPPCIQITTGGNLINYLGELSTQTADLTTSNPMWNSILSTDGDKYMCLDIKNFYLTSLLD